MHCRRLLARTTAVATTCLLTVGGLAATSWAGTATITGGAFVLDNGTKTVSFTGTGPYVPNGPVTVKLVRHGSAATQDALTGSGTATSPSAGSATVDFTRANPGAYDFSAWVGASASGPATDSCTSCVTVIGLHPVVTSMSPATLGEGTTGGGYQNVVITGQNFTKGPYDNCGTAHCTGPLSVVALRAGVPDPNVGFVQTVNSSGTPTPTAPTATTITLRANVTGTDTAAYTDDVRVTNSDGKTGTCTGCLTIEPAIALTSVALTPKDFPQSTLPVNTAQIGAGATGQTLVLTGTHFPDDAVATFGKPAGTSASDTSVINVGHAAVTHGASTDTLTLTGVDTTQVAKTGAWTVAVTSAADHATSDGVPLQVNPAPVATGVDDVNSSTGAYGQGAHQVKLDVHVDHTAPFFAGSGLDPDSAPHTLVHLAAPSGYTITNQVATAGPGNSDNIVEVTLNVPTTPVGDYAITVVNPDGGTSAPCSDNPIPALNTCLFSVAAGPSVASISPSTAAKGTTAHSVVIKGTGFHTGSNNVNVTIGSGGTPLFTANETATNATTIPVGDVAVPGTATSPADLDVTVVNVDDKGLATGAGLFHIANLSVSGADLPGSDNDPGDSPLDLTINGTNFGAGATAKLVRAGVADIPGTVTPSSTDTTTALFRTFDLGNVAPGAYDIVVTNPSGPDAGTASCTACFQVLASAPAISTVQPSQLGGGASNVTVTVTGTNIFPGAALVFSDAKVTTVGPATVTPPGQLTQVVSVAPDATANAGTVKVVNTDAQQSPAQAFTVDAGPTVSGLSPAERAAGQTFALTVTGGNFHADPGGARLAFSDDRITAANYVITGSQLTADVTVPAAVAAAAPASIHVSVVNPDLGQATSPTDLVLVAKPTIDSLDPASAPAGHALTLHVFGNHFGPGATISSADASFAVSDVSVVSEHEVDASIDTTGTPVGNHDVVVDNGDGGTAHRALDIYGKPGVPTALVVVPHDGSIAVSWSPPASDGGGALASYTATLTEHGVATAAAGYTSPDATTHAHTFSGLVNGKQYDVSVVATNGAGNGPAANGHATPKFRTALSISRSATSVAAGHRVRLHGVLTRSDGHRVPAATVKVYRTLNGHTARIALVKTSATGVWTLTLRPKHTAAYQARFGGDAADRGIRSAPARVRVHA